MKMGGKKSKIGVKMAIFGHFPTFSSKNHKQGVVINGNA